MISNIESNYNSVYELFEFENQSNFLSFKECRKEVRKCKFKSVKEYLKNRKSNWPSRPSRTYKNQGWINYCDFLGNGFLSFKECRKEVRKCKFKNIKEYIKNRKSNWTSTPYRTYKNQGWINYCDFLGNGFLSFKECRKEVRKCKFKSVKEYQKNRKSNWPSLPDRGYKNKGWINWYDFLGKKK